MWRRTSEDGVEVVGRFEKTADDNQLEVGRTRLRSPRADDLLFCGEEGALCKALQAVESSGHAQQRNGHQSLRR